MALSGSKNYTDTVTAATVIALALRRLGVLDHQDTIDSTEEADALIVLNLMVKEWTKLGLDNWLRQTCALWLVAPGSQSTYTIGPSGSRAAHQWWETELTAGAGAAAASITVDEIDTTHCINGSYVGIRLDDGDIHFTTINGVPTTTITLTTALPSAAASGNRVYVYGTTYQADRPSRILYASRATLDTTNTSAAYDALIEQESEVRIIGMDEYRTMANKRITGIPVSVYYEPTITNGTIYVWPTGITSQDYDKIYLTYNIYADDFDVTSNNAEFPPEWMNTLAWNLASELAPEYGISEREQLRLMQRAGGHLTEMLDNDVENANAIFEKSYQPGVRP